MIHYCGKPHGDDFRRNYIPQFKGFTIMYVGEGRYASISND